MSLRYLENAGASVVCLLPKHIAEACLMWQNYRATSHILYAHTHTFPTPLSTDKGLLQVQSTSKTTGNTLCPRVVLLFIPCSSLTNTENALPISQIEDFLQQRNRGLILNVIHA